jgi:dihydrolipoamide dehydrogenase
MKTYDLAIIGSGPGGYTAAILGAQQGLKVALIEEKNWGGICLNVGCIPTKMLLKFAEKFSQIKNSSLWNIHLENLTINYSETIQKKDAAIQVLRKNLENLFIANKIDLIQKRASFIDENTLQIDQDKIVAKNIIIATGSECSSLPQFPFDQTSIFSSTDILNLKTLPRSIAIIGGGYIGCEFATYFNALNVDVSLIEASSQLLPQVTSKISEELKRSFIKKKMEVLTNEKIIKIEKDHLNVILHTNQNRILEKEKVLICVGRSSCSRNLNLSSLKLDSKGFIEVNDQMQTNIGHIYAIGDVTGKMMLAHVASMHAEVAISHILHKKSSMNYNIPSVVFSDPEIASIGLTEEQALKNNQEILVGSYPYRALGKSIALNELEGFAQIIADKKNHQILGAHIIGKDASNLISEMTLAIQYKHTLEDVAHTIHPHPTTSEIWHEACLLALNTPIHFPPKKKLL